MKPLLGILSFLMTMIFSVACFVMIPLWILSGGDLEKVFASDSQQMIAKTSSIGGILFGVIVGIFLWTSIMRRRYSDDEITNFSDRWLKALGINRMIVVVLRKLRREP